MNIQEKNTRLVLSIITALFFILNFYAFFANKNKILNEFEEISRLEKTPVKTQNIQEFIKIESPLSFFDSALDELNLKENLKALQITGRQGGDQIIIQLENLNFKSMTSFLNFIQLKKIHYPHYIEILPRAQNFDLTVRIML